MNHSDHVALLRAGVLDATGRPAGLTWADLGSGTGAFTLALADLLGPQGIIYSVDRDSDALAAQRRAVGKGLGAAAPDLHYLVADYAKPLALPPLDGIIMANTLHFHREVEPVVRMVMSYLRPSGQLIVIEYGADHGNVWVPHPFSYPTWERIAARCGLLDTRLLMTVPSRFLGSIYSAVSQAPKEAA
jgi:SAM-dependent methyltransferase